MECVTFIYDGQEETFDINNVLPADLIEDFGLDPSKAVRLKGEQTKINFRFEDKGQLKAGILCRCTSQSKVYLD